MLKVLIADDNREFNELLTTYLSMEPDFEIIGSAYNGKALEMIKQEVPDVLLLDIIMPHLDGIGVLEALAEMDLDPRPHVIMLTAFGHENITRQAVELGASYYILKPFNMETLAGRIRQLKGSVAPVPPAVSSVATTGKKATAKFLLRKRSPRFCTRSESGPYQRLPLFA